MARKPIPMPVAENPGYPSLADATERILESQHQRQEGEFSAYIACPNCGEELVTVKPPIRPTAYDGIQCLRCNECGWTGSIPAGGAY